MTHHALRVERLSKRYLLGEEHTDLLSERLGNLLRGRWRKSERRELWALRDISFEVPQGEVLGIIGRNGAGKSTLLKILSRITAPTGGRAVVQGRLASLLEVGTGFHPELTGRENIYLNGTILGMKKREIDRKFDDIVAFSEVEMFLDTPIKRYSSGMYVRLAFAVAAHLEPDVLVVDEVLAVGDRQFQEKCLGRMDSIAKTEGRTVLFVSHNLDAVTRICTGGLYLRAGTVAARTSIREAVERYIADTSPAATDLAVHNERWGDGRVRITGFHTRDASDRPVDALSSGGDFKLILTYETEGSATVNDVVASLSLADARGVTVLLVSSEFANQRLRLSATGEIVCTVRDLNLAPGTYSLTLYLGHSAGETFDCLNDVRTIDVIGGDYFHTGHPGYPEQCRSLTRSSWSVL